MQSSVELRAEPGGDSGTNVPVAEITIVALLALTVTAIAWRAFPLWDDGLMLLLSQHGGGQAVNDTIGDRPIMARLLQLIIDSGHWRETAAVMHWLTWLGMGWVTLRLWSLLFPAHRNYGLVAACLAATPVLCQIQTILLSVIVPSVIGPLVVFMVVLPFLSPRSARRTNLQIGLRWIVMVVSVAAVTMVSEYALATVAASTVLLAGSTASDRRSKRLTWVTIGLLLVTAFASYAVYHHVANAEARMSVRPEAQDWGFRSKWLAPRMFTDVWRLALGTFLERLGGIHIWNTREALVGLFAGALGALFLAWHTRGGPNLQTTDEGVEIGNTRVLLSLLGAITLGILPVVAMGHGSNTWSSSRFWAPVLPVSAILAVYLPLLLFRRRMWWIVPVVCGFVAGFVLLNDGLLAIHERDRFVALGDQLESHVPATGLTVAIVQCTWRYPLPYPKEWDITARLTMNWPQTKRDHFWAFAGIEQVYLETVQRDGKTNSVLDDPFGPHPQLLRAWREITRQLVEAPRVEPVGGVTDGNMAARPEKKAEDVRQILWVTEGPNGKINVERLPTRTAGGD
jgi:hypothetical protein